MTPKKFFLDTNSLIALAGLQGEELRLFVTHLRKTKAELCISHVQIDETYSKEFPTYHEKITMALRRISEKGIEISPLRPTTELVIGISRIGYAKLSDEEFSKIDDSLRSELRKCMGKRAEDMNLARDALIALSSLDCDYFITSDRYLHKSWLKVIVRNDENRKILSQTHKIPEIVYARPTLQKLSQEIMKKVS